MKPAPPNALARALRRFFAEHLPGVRGASPHTVTSYRDAWALLLRFLAARTERPVVELDLGDLDPDAIVAFLDHLEQKRGNSTTTRNVRLAALHAFARYAATLYPEWLETCQRLLAVPFKRARTRVVEYLEANEIRALIEAIDPCTPTGRRDHTLFLTLFNTGARVQELLDLRPVDLQLDRPYQVRLLGKGRKERFCPLWPQTAQLLRRLVAETGLDQTSTQRLFRNRHGEPLTRFGVRYLLRKYAKLAQPSAPSLARKRVHPHILRHTTAVHLLQAGVDLITISHWLGHASVETTNRYTAVDLETKRAAIARAMPVADIEPGLASWRSDVSILDWLEAL
ncbi:MAG: tyrosine-type recombinase/integrase [bacterium]|nr:tyrosine-type recombinase/integrase [bacterium]